MPSVDDGGGFRKRGTSSAYDRESGDSRARTTGSGAGYTVSHTWK
ncbi:hypothetical protein [Streptomyces sp. NPDC086182]|jgi:hypothetical protein